MKASEVLRRYAAGERNFRGVNLSGQSFKDENLSGADFGKADLRSTNFQGATLVKTDFTHANFGLRTHWCVLLIIFSLFLASFSAIWSNFAFSLLQTDVVFGFNQQPLNWVGLMILVSILLIWIRDGIKIKSGILPLLLGLSIFVSTIATAGTVSKDAALRALVLSLAFASISIAVFSLSIALTVAFAIAGKLAFSSIAISTLIISFLQIKYVISTDVVTGIFTLITVIIAATIAFLTVREEEQDSWIRSYTIFITAIKGTNFYQANLTDAHFTKVNLRGINLRKANLTRVNWYKAKMLGWVRIDNTYLKSIQIRQWLIGKGIDKNFDGQKLQGVNFQGADLSGASFIDTNLNEANLQDANLSGAKLIQTQLDKTNLTGATLTGACIEDWGITSHTKLDEVKCEYIFMRSPTKSDPNPWRKPDNRQEKFKGNDFADFIQPVFDTLDLYHNQGVEPKAIAISWKKLTEDNPDANLRYVSLEVKGENNLLLRLKAEPNADLSKLSADYFETYNYFKQLAAEEAAEKYVVLLEEKDDRINSLENFVKIALEKSSSTVNIQRGNYNEHIGGNYSEG